MTGGVCQFHTIIPREESGAAIVRRDGGHHSDRLEVDLDWHSVASGKYCGLDPLLSPWIRCIWQQMADVLCQPDSASAFYLNAPFYFVQHQFLATNFLVHSVICKQ